jgi:hypothetical protein
VRGWFFSDSISCFSVINLEHHIFTILNSIRCRCNKFTQSLTLWNVRYPISSRDLSHNLIEDSLGHKCILINAITTMILLVYIFIHFFGINLYSVVDSSANIALERALCVHGLGGW